MEGEPVSDKYEPELYAQSVELVPSAVKCQHCGNKSPFGKLKCKTCGAALDYLNSALISSKAVFNKQKYNALLAVQAYADKRISSVTQSSVIATVSADTIKNAGYYIAYALYGLALFVIMLLGSGIAAMTLGKGKEPAKKNSYSQYRQYQPYKPYSKPENYPNFDEIFGQQGE
jgi:hypothetical protein